MKITAIIFLFLILAFLAGCADQGTGRDKTAPNPVTKTPAVLDQASEDCALENCHGLDFTCGPNAPQVCNEMYALGDFCRQYAICETISGKCQLVAPEKLEACKTCVSKCNNPDGEAAFECESGCREEINKLNAQQ
jgi:hypothetical protein